MLNGVDYDVWNPEIDPSIPVRYTADDVAGKYAAKAALRDRLWLRHDFSPVVAYVGRLDRQKGVPLIRHAARYALAQGAQFVLLGTASEHSVSEEFWRLKAELNDHPDCHIEVGYSHDLAHLVYAGADLLIVPSMFEPCGLTQLIGLKYGTVPVVRHTGGLVNTVHDRDHADVPAGQRNGYVFHHDDSAGAGVGAGPGDRAVARLPGPVPRPDAHRDAPRPLLGRPRHGLHAHLRPHPAQVGVLPEAGVII